MALYLVGRTDNVGWDEHDAVIVRAKNEEDARAMVLEFSDPNRRWSEDSLHGFTARNMNVTKITAAGARGVVLASFNAA